MKKSSALGFLLLCASQQLQASSYADSKRITVLYLDEAQGNAATRGYYTTRFAGTDVYGFITIDSAEGAAGSYYYRGTFQDHTLGSTTSQDCSGDILIRRHQQPGRGTGLAAEVTWKPLKGQGCGNSIGKTLVLDLPESLPKADARGDFTAANANTMRSETNGDVTWPAWRVASADGELNCRKDVTGRVVYTYKADEAVIAETRGGNAFIEKNQRSWLLTRRGCHVRANQNYIEALSIPENYIQ